jgi:hypothetical protein
MIETEPNKNILLGSNKNIKERHSQTSWFD